MVAPTFFALQAYRRCLLYNLATTILHARRATEREANVATLLSAIPTAIVITDDDDDGAHTGSTGSVGCWPIARRAWTRNVKATHHLVLEDDAHLCDGFNSLAELAIERRPDAQILFFFGWRGCSVASVWPVEHLTKWITLADNLCSTIPHHDMLQTMGAKALGVPIVYTIPSLVEHLPFPSLLGHGKLVADVFNQSPTDFDLMER